MRRTCGADNRRLWAFLAASAVLATARLAFAVSSEAAGALHINWWTWDAHAPPMGWFLVDFGLFLVGLIYFTAKPIAQAFGERHVAIRKAIADAAAAHAKASMAQAEARQKLAGLEAEVRELLEVSLTDGEAERAQAVLDADAYARRMKADTSALADQELKRARLRLQDRTMRQSLLRARALLEQDIDAADQARLLDASIDAMGAPENWRLKPLHGQLKHTAPMGSKEAP